ncbi:MAG: T9SS C-terminal target domain-containing protein [Calditrichaeota bacterium]|nr:MAG: T9SS C-terminal target domain-containing protein [Calditrichota bacterium]
MKICLVLSYVFLGVSMLWSQEFRQEISTIPVIINNRELQTPFSGGINVSNPVLVDIDNDGDLDLFVGDFRGELLFYKNQGSAAKPFFTLEDLHYAGIDVGADATPTFTDLDNDGDYDLIIGNDDGHLFYYKNTGNASEPAFELVTENFANVQTGGDSAPSFTDIDQDGDMDLFVGSNSGNIFFFRNNGTADNPSFSFVTQFFASIEVGFDSQPAFVDIDHDGDADLFVGEDAGNINFFRNLGPPLNPIFIPETSAFASILVEFDSAPTFGDLNGDGEPDLIVGDNSGNIQYFINNGNEHFTQVAKNLLNLDVGNFCTIAFADIDADGDYDLFLGEQEGNINFFKNTGTAQEPEFTLITEQFAGIDVGAASAPTFVDLDNDSDLDLLVGEDAGNINFFRNRGSATRSDFSQVTSNLISVAQFSIPFPVDIDRDGDFDLFIGEQQGQVFFSQNSGTPQSAKFNAPMPISGIDVGDFSAPTLADLDQDGDFDLLVGESFGNINFYRNMGTARAPLFVLETETFAGISVGEFSAPYFVDIDDDKDLDLFIGTGDGGIYFYRNVTPTEVQSPSATIPGDFVLYQNYPNPFNPTTTIRYDLPRRVHVTIEIVNLLGKKIKTLLNSWQNPGTYSVQWDGTDDHERKIPSGVYLYRFKAEKLQATRKIILLR